MIDWLLARPPKIGSEWGIRGRINPFDDEGKVIVREIKSGWVKYAWKWAEHHSVFFGSCLTIRSFRSLYKEIQSESKTDD